MTAQQQIFRVRRNYNQWVANQTLEDYALRFTAKSARRWSAARVANTALGAISFLALEAIGAAITLNYGFDNAVAAICVVGAIIFMMGLPIAYYAAKYGVDIDLLTRGAGFGYIGSTITSLIYASFTFIFFAIEAAIMAMALEILFGIPLTIGYLVSALLVIPLVTHGITFISRFQLWSQPLWIALQLLPFVYIAWHDIHSVDDWMQYEGAHGNGEGLSLLLFGAASSVIFSLIAQIGEQVDFLRFLPAPEKGRRLRWWVAMISAGPGWIVVGTIKILAGSFLAVLALQHGVSTEDAMDPTRMYSIAFGYLTTNPHVALALAGIFVILCQLKINVTNSYAGSIAWSNFFSRLTHSHPGRVVWLVFNVSIALLLMELGIYRALEKTLGVYAMVAVAWMGALVADLVINKPLGLSPPHIEFKRAHLYDINPVGFGSMLMASALGISAHLGVFGETLQALSPYLALGSAFVLAPLIAWATKGRFYIARPSIPMAASHDAVTCCICEHSFEPEDMTTCPAYGGHICSLCCSLDARCHDLCKPHGRLSQQIISALRGKLPDAVLDTINSRFGHFIGLLLVISTCLGLLLSVVYYQIPVTDTATAALVATILWKEYFVLLIVAGVIAWLFVLAHESRVVAQEESQRQTRLLQEEIIAHERTDLLLQQAKEVAEAANQAKSRYLTGISHELRTPLNAVLGYAQLLEDDPQIPASRRDSIAVIRRSSEHLADLIEGLLDISKIEAGKLDLHRDQVRIRTLLDQIVNMFRIQAQAKGIDFAYHQETYLPDVVTTDEKRLRQILINLLSNAIKYTERGVVSLTVRYRNQVAEFTIRDSGVGIAADDLERIFRPFERIRKPGAPYVHGTGLGLTITRLLTDIMGGDISVQSEPGVGSTFTVALMLSSVAVSPAATPMQQRVRGYVGEPRTILLVDDEPSQRGLLAELLLLLGFRIIEADSGDACLALARQQPVDAILLDINMPDLSGWQVAQQLREQGTTSVIIMISANAGEAAAAPEQASYHNDYLAKPVRLQMLVEKLGTHLRLQWLLDQPRAPAPVAPARQTFEPGQLPAADDLSELKAMAEIGFVNGLKKKLDELESAGRASPAFIQHVQRLIGQFRFDLIIELVEAAT